MMGLTQPPKKLGGQSSTLSQSYKMHRFIHGNEGCLSLIAFRSSILALLKTSAEFISQLF